MTQRASTAGIDAVAALAAIGEAGRMLGMASSDRALARQLGVSHSTVSRWRRGVCRPNVRNLEALRDLVSDWQQHVLSRRDLRSAGTASAVALLTRSVDALTSDADRAWEAEMAADMVRNLEGLFTVNAM